MLVFLVISDLESEAAVTIATSSDFETWWTTNEAKDTKSPNYQGNGLAFCSVDDPSPGQWGKLFIDGQPTPSTGPASNLSPVSSCGTKSGWTEDRHLFDTRNSLWTYFERQLLV